MGDKLNAAYRSQMSTSHSVEESSNWNKQYTSSEPEDHCHIPLSQKTYYVNTDLSNDPNNLHFENTILHCDALKKGRHEYNEDQVTHSLSCPRSSSSISFLNDSSEFDGDFSDNAFLSQRRSLRLEDPEEYRAEMFEGERDNSPKSQMMFSFSDDIVSRRESWLENQQASNVYEYKNVFPLPPDAEKNNKFLGIYSPRVDFKPSSQYVDATTDSLNHTASSKFPHLCFPKYLFPSEGHICNSWARRSSILDVKSYSRKQNCYDTTQYNRLIVRPEKTYQESYMRNEEIEVPNPSFHQHSHKIFPSTESSTQLNAVEKARNIHALELEIRKDLQDTLLVPKRKSRRNDLHKHL